ncbi:MAG: CsgG/HfaB family protein [bacterium]|nr:CsgG/HfaB family protein [bacterium]
MIYETVGCSVRKRKSVVAFGLVALAMFLNPTAPAFAQKCTIAIGKIEYRAELSETDKDRHAYGRREPAENTKAFIDMLSTALSKTRKFDVIERDRLAAIIKEQGLGESGLLDESTAHTLGGLKGVDYLLLGAITQYGIDKKAMGFGGVAMGAETARMSVDIKIIEVKSGSVKIADTVEETQKGGRALKVEDKVDMASASGQVLSDVMRKTSNSVVNVIVSAIYPIKVISTTKGIMLNYGEGILMEGDVLDVFSQGEKVTDPDTGEVLGSEEEKVGRIKVIKALAKFSKAQILEGDGKIEKGMVCRKIREKELKQEKKSKRKRKKLHF